MISAKQYYSYINQKFIISNENLFADCCDEKLTLLKVPRGRCEPLIKLLNTVESKYGFNMQKMCALNYNQFVLWQNSFSKEYKEKELIIALKFVVLCCLADKFLDSDRYSDEEKIHICNKINIKNLLSTQKYESPFFTEMDVLLNDIREFLISDHVCNVPERDYIIECIRDAFLSEIYMYKNPLQKKEKNADIEMHLLIDKSVKFEIAAFLLATIGSNSTKTIEAATYSANIFWLIDDLCDFVEDVHCKRKNSMLFYCVKDNAELLLSERVEISFNNVDIFINALEENMKSLKQIVDNKFYDYMLNEIWGWCSNVRKLSQ